MATGCNVLMCDVVVTVLPPAIQQKIFDPPGRQAATPFMNGLMTPTTGQLLHCAVVFCITTSILA
jgi:hypothetical protein